MQAKEFNESLNIEDLIQPHLAIQLCLQYIRDFPQRQETVECLDLVHQLLQKQRQHSQLVLESLASILLQDKLVNSSVELKETQSTSSESSQLLTDAQSLMSSLASNYIKLDNLPKPFDQVFDLIQKYLQLDLFICAASNVELTETTFKLIYKALKHSFDYVKDEIFVC